MGKFNGFEGRVKVDFLPYCIGKEITFTFERAGRYKAFSVTKIVHPKSPLKVGLRTKDPCIREERRAEAYKCLQRESRRIAENQAGLDHEEVVALANRFYDDYRFHNEDRVINVHTTTATVAYCRQRALWWLATGQTGLRILDKLCWGITDRAKQEEAVKSFFKVHPDDNTSPQALEAQFGMLLSAYGPNDNIREEDRYHILIEIRQLMKYVAANGDLKPAEFFIEPGTDQHIVSMMNDHVASVKRYERTTAHIEDSQPAKSLSSQVTWDQLLEFWQEIKPVRPETVWVYKRAVAVAVEIFGHAFAGRLTRTDFFRWKARILQHDTVGIKTARQSHLTALNRLLNVGVHYEVLPKNNLKGITIHDDSEPSQGGREYTADEVKAILDIATKSSEPLHRWVPFILATSGARAKEITSLWHDQIKQEGDVWCFHLKLTKDGIKPKNKSSYRTVPIHQSVLNAGFLDFVKTRVGKPLFYDPPAVYGKYHPAGVQVTGLGEYIKKIRDKDCKKPPCHGFRHTVISTLRKVEVDSDKRDYIVGHKRRGEQDTYGNQWFEGLKQTVDRFPSYGA